MQVQPTDVDTLIDTIRDHGASTVSREAAQALGRIGAAAVPALHTALAAFPIPAQEDTGTWFADESTKYWLLSALAEIGAAAAPVTPIVIAMLQDMEGYRDTRHQAKKTLTAIGLPETAQALLAELAGQDGESNYFVLDALSALPREVLLETDGLQGLLAELLSDPDSWPYRKAEFIQDKIA